MTTDIEAPRSITTNIVLDQHKGGRSGKGGSSLRTGLEEWSRRVDAPVLILGLGVCGGASLYLLAPVEPDWRLIGIGFGFAVGLLLSRRLLSSGPLIYLTAMAIVGVGFGAFAGKVRAVFADAPVLEREIGPLQIDGWVTGVDAGDKGPRLRVRLLAAQGLTRAQTPVMVRVTHRLNLEINPGDFVRCRVVLRPPPRPSAPGDYDFQRQAWFEQLGAVGYVQGRCRAGVDAAPLALIDHWRISLARFRRDLGSAVAVRAGERAGGFAAALVTGDRSLMRSEDRVALRASGLAHLLAVSGLHMGIVGGLLYVALRRGLVLIEPLALRVPVQKLAAIGALGGCAAYLVVSGGSVATQRAFITAAVFFTAVLADRPALSIRSFGLALMLVALLRPESVLTPGFQMSFAATGVLIAVYEAWTRRRRDAYATRASQPVYAMSSLIVTSVAASAATAPFTLFHFARIAQFGLIANFLAMPLVAFVAAPAAGMALALSPFGLSAPPLRIFGLALEGVLIVAHALSSNAQGVGFHLGGVSLLVFVAAIAATILLRGRLRLGTTTALILLGVIVAGTQPPRFEFYWSRSGDVFVYGGDGAIQRYALIEGDALPPIDLSGLPVDPTCNDARCRLKTIGKNWIEISAKDGPEPFVVLRNSDTIYRLSWSDVQAFGGAGVRQTRSGHLIWIKPRPCGRRPWTACHDP
ncbi:MAG: ComEC/Rec2 family competence protein [Pseudomonadota bacterium]